MNKKFTTVQEALAHNREILDKLANLDEIAQTRELNEEEKKTLAALQREHQGLTREITFMNQQAAAASHREVKSKNAIMREALDFLRANPNRELTLGTVGSNPGGSITESGAIALNIHDLIGTLNEGLGLPSTLTLVTGVTGNDLWPVSVDDVDLEELGENVEVNDQNLHFDNIQAVAHRVSLAVSVSNSAIDNAAFDVFAFVQGKFQLALRRYLAKKVYSQANFTGVKGPFSNLASSGDIEIADGKTYKNILKAVAEFTNKGFDSSMVVLVIDAITEAELKATKKAEDAGFVIENGTLAGYPYVVTHYINTTLDSDGKSLKGTTDRYIGIGYFNYLALQQHGTVSLRVDNSSAAQARKNLTTFVFNSAFSATDLSKKLNKKGGTTTQAFALYKLTQPSA